MSPKSATTSLLMTGATGMLGAAVLARLLRQGYSCAVIARGRAKLDPVSRMDRILGRFEQGWNIQLPRPRVFEGDLNRANLGLDTNSTQWIAEHCDTVLHSAASLSFYPAEEDENNEPYRTNLGGTENVMLLAQRAGIDSFHHVSTAYVCGLQTGRVLESGMDNGQSMANDYERSKLQAEMFLRERWNRGESESSASQRSLTVYRPSIVVDPTGITPVSGDRTIYGAFSLYQILASRFGLPVNGQWFRNLGFRGGERKNLVDVHWISEAIDTILCHPEFHGRTYHLTATSGTTIEELEEVFRQKTEPQIAASQAATEQPDKAASPAFDSNAVDKIAAPFVNTFLPYFRDDPTFDRANIDRVINATSLRTVPEIGPSELSQMVSNWSSELSASLGNRPRQQREGTPTDTQSVAPEKTDPPINDDVVLVGYEVRLPDGVDDVRQFEELLYRGQSAITELPPDRLDRELYLDPRPGTPGKTYTEIGGWVNPEPLCQRLEESMANLGRFDLTHRQFAHVAVKCLQSALGTLDICEHQQIDATRAGVFVGHSGGTQSGGALALGTLADSATRLIDSTGPATCSANERQAIRGIVTESIRSSRPRREKDGSPEFNAYSAASLAARLLGFNGRREVIDAACSSSLIALQHAALAIRSNRLDLALVGGATYNNVDNLALFSQTGACSAKGSFPFDSRASGLVSSEGYVAVLVARKSVAIQTGMPILATLQGVGISSDGKGKGLWAPRSEGQQLAMRRANANGTALEIDYLECHSTSTQVGDATELTSLDALLDANRKQKLPIGSVKSNLGHLLEAAGLVGLVKCLIAMRRGEIPPSINFASPTKSFDWDAGRVRVVRNAEPWPQVPSKTAAVNAFGIGGLNAHAVIRENNHQSGDRSEGLSPRIKSEPLAIVGRGVVLPGACDVVQFSELLTSGESRLESPPLDRWPRSQGRLLGMSNLDPQEPPMHVLGGYVHDFRFDAQSYRIPPKIVANANPAQLMLIEAVRQAMNEYDGGTWSVDRTRVSVSIGTMFGGQFSNELQIGLRLPEICRDLRRAAIASGTSVQDAEDWADKYYQATLKAYPALLDETGGFTASTMASRIARTFNLMGGACAVDSDEASSGLALLVAAEQLSAGNADLVICGTAQRSLDLVAIEQLYRNRRLSTSRTTQELIEDPSKIFPAEGVAIILLQRLQDAIDSGQKVFGVIEGIKETFQADVVKARRQHGHASLNQDCFPNPKIVTQIGHLGGGQGLVQTVAASIACDRQSQATPVDVREIASDGYQVQYSVSPHLEPASPDPAISQSSSATSAGIVSSLKDSSDHSASEPVETNTVIQSVTTPATVLSICLGSESPLGLGQRLSDLASRGSELDSLQTAQENWRQELTMPCTAIITGESSQQICMAAQDLLSGPIQQQRSGASEKHAALVRLPDVVGERIAWTYPGQGSQYAAIPRAFDVNETCAQSLERFDQILTEMGLDKVGERLHDPDNRLGRDVWWTQLWLLAVGTSLSDFLTQRGLRPDVVLGHSFGECTAAWAAGVMSTSDAIAFAKHRSEAVTMHGGPRGELLSVRCEPSHVDSVLRRGQSSCTITHHNSPQQTVIAGCPESIAKAKALFSAEGIASVVIPVPAAFHTPAMRGARDVLAARQSTVGLRPPRFAFLSATQNRYLAEPTEILSNLVDQLITPVGFSGAIERLLTDGCGLIVEVGPSNVLTRLAQATSDSRAICISADQPGIPTSCMLRLIELASVLFSGSTAVQSPANRSIDRSSHWSNNNARLSGMRGSETGPLPGQVSEPRNEPSIRVVDVTRRGRRGNGRADKGNGTPRVGISANQRPIAKAQTSNSPSNRIDDLSSTPATDMSSEFKRVVESQQSLPAETVDYTNNSAAKDFLFDLVIDLTGYEPDVVDFDADLEAELGVDSIKKAQLIGELVQWAGLDITPADVRLGDYQSMSDILGLVSNPALVANARSGSQEPEFTTNEENTTSNDVAVDPQALRRLMIDLLVDQTGYDEEIIDMDADLESELGVDSIKRAQLLGELEQQFELPPIQQTDLKLSDFPTLRSIHEFIMDQVGGSKKKRILH